MKLHSLEIANFRAIEKLSLDFTDYLGRPRPINLLVGPNGSGKTSILDAIHVVVKIFENPRQPDFREGLEYSVQQLVRGRGTLAEIIFEFSLDQEEAAAINAVYAALELNQHFNLEREEQPPLNIPTKIRWIYPNIKPSGRSAYFYEYLDKNAVRVLGARGRASQAKSRGLFYDEIFEKIGGVCYLDQRRSIRLHKIFEYQPNQELREHGDVLSWLNDYYRKHLSWNQEKYGESYWQRIQRLFNKICYPAELIGLESGPGVETLILRKNGTEYDLLQMSSGEHQILRILVSLTAETAKNSIVLIDEVELHLHPTWQKRLIYVLREDSYNNQYIFTTHSPAVMKLFYDSEIISLGALEVK